MRTAAVVAPEPVLKKSARSALGTSAIRRSASASMMGSGRLRQKPARARAAAG